VLKVDLCAGGEYQPNDGAVIAPKPPLFAALSSGFIVPFSIGQSLGLKR
jgi:hypothetical protein